MIQLNLLPDVKLEYIKANKTRSLAISISAIVTIISIVILLFMLSIDGLQKKHLDDLTSDITKDSSTLQNEPQINKILTVQNQLESLTALHASKPAAAQLFTYINQVTPTTVTISGLSIDFTQQTITAAGASDSLSSINTFIDTLKYTNYTIAGQNGSSPAFSNVVLSSFGINGQAKDPSQAASYTITLSYDPTIFNITKNINLNVPNLVPTQAQTPGSVFVASPDSSDHNGGGDK
jgi:hypothetical protein